MRGFEWGEDGNLAVFALIVVFLGPLDVEWAEIQRPMQ